MTRPALDRRAPYKGDQRRLQLLSALDALLQERTLDAVNVADISERAGVSRSAFYFYFDNKAVAVAALLNRMNEQAEFVASALLEVEGTPRERFEQQIRGAVDVLEKHRYLYRAMLEARQLDASVRDVWDADRNSFVSPIAELIEAERVAGNAPPGPDSRALATILLDLNDRSLERLALGDPLPVEERIDALVTVWVRTIYGTGAPSGR